MKNGELSRLNTGKKELLQNEEHNKMGFICLDEYLARKWQITNAFFFEKTQN